MEAAASETLPLLSLIRDDCGRGSHVAKIQATEDLLPGRLGQTLWAVELRRGAMATRNRVPLKRRARHTSPGILLLSGCPRSGLFGTHAPKRPRASRFLSSAVFRGGAERVARGAPPLAGVLVFAG